MKLFFYDCVSVDDKIFFSAINYNGLFEYSKSQQQVRLLKCFDKDEPGQTFLHSRILKYNSSLWLIPNNSKCIYEYNIETQELNSYDMLEYGMKTSAICSYFLGGEIADSKLYLFPCRYEGILIFDLNEKKFDKVIRIDDSWKDLDGVYSFKGACIHESKIFIASMKENFYEIIDLASETRKRVTLKDDYKGITHLLVRDNELVLVGHNGKIGFYDFDGERKHITQFELTTDVHKFFDVCEKNGVLFLTENDKNKVAVYDTLSNEKEELNYPICEEKELKEFWAHFTFIKCEDDEMILQSAYDGGICCINGRHIEKIADVDWTITDEERKLLNFELEGIVTEQFGCDLKWFLGKLGLFNK